MFFLETQQTHGWRGFDMVHENITSCLTDHADIERRELFSRWIGSWTRPVKHSGSSQRFLSYGFKQRGLWLASAPYSAAFLIHTQDPHRPRLACPAAI